MYLSFDIPFLSIPFTLLKAQNVMKNAFECYLFYNQSYVISTPDFLSMSRIKSFAPKSVAIQ